MRIKEYNNQGICQEQYCLHEVSSLVSLDNKIIKNYQKKKVVTIISYENINGKRNVLKTIATTPKHIIQFMHIKCKTLFYDLFLPIGYPQTVKKVYLQYQLYDSIQGLCSYLRGIASTSAILQAAGVGNANATSLSAAITWVIKDGIGLIGGLFYSYTFSCYFDSHVKEFRLCADIFNDIGLTIDMLAPMFDPSYFMILSSCSTLCKVICGIAANATKSSITIYLANNGNIADLNAKEATQETAVSLLGMIGGVLIARVLHNSNIEDENADLSRDGVGSGSIITTYAWIYFITLTVIHIWANYKGVRLLRLNTLNRERLEHVIHPITDIILQQINNKRPSFNSNDVNDTITSHIQSMKSPNDVDESLFSSMSNLIGYYSNQIHLGVRLSTILQLSSKLQDSHLLFTWLVQEEFIHEHYFLWVENVHDFKNKKMMNVFVCLRLNATSLDECKAFIHAFIIHQFYYHQSNENHYNNHSDSSSLQDVIKMTHQIVNLLLDDIKGLHTTMNTTSSNNTLLLGEDNKRDKYNKISLIDALQSLGWDCTRFYLNYGSYRVTWDDDDDVDDYSKKNE